MNGSTASHLDEVPITTKDSSTHSTLCTSTDYSELGSTTYSSPSKKEIIRSIVTNEKNGHQELQNHNGEAPQTQNTANGHRFAPSSNEEDGFFGVISKIFILCFALLGVFFRFIKAALKKKNDKRLLKDAATKLKEAQSYAEWEQAAAIIDSLEGKDLWRKAKESSLYDYKLIEHRLATLRHLSKIGNHPALMLTLREGMLRNLGGIGDVKLFKYALTGTKYLVEEYVEEVVRQLQHMYELPEEQLPLEQKIDFFYELRQTFGRSALLLSGGVTFGMYHVGVIKALSEVGLLPRVMSGSSAGSIIAAVVCTHTDEELPELFKSEGWNLNVFDKRPGGSLLRKIIRLFKKGVLMNMKVLEAAVRDNLGDITFKEAFDRTKRVLNISVTSYDKYEFSRILNYITAPNVLIWSAACASCALPFMFQPVELMAKDANGNIYPYHPHGQKWIDGSMNSDLPITRLSELFNVNHFIVSQVNPYVAPFLYHTESEHNGLLYAVLGLLKSEVKHRLSQLTELGLIPLTLRKFQGILHQQYHGDITIIPEMHVSDYRHLISNPSVEILQQFIERGLKSTWPKIPLIKNHCMIELALEKYFNLLIAELQQRKSTTSKYLKAHDTFMQL